MKKFKIIILCASILFFYGCAGMHGSDRIDGLNDKIATLSASLDSTNAKIEDLNNKILLLNDKIETMKQKSAGPPPVSAAPIPPQGLKVVSLGQGDEKPAGQALKTTAPHLPVPPMPVVNGNPQDLYKRGRDLFLSGKYAASRAVFLTFLKEFPKDPLDNNARYWIGESYYSEGAYEKALKFFEEVVEKYPGDYKAPACLLKAGFSYYELNNIEKARESLERLVRLYPRSEAAQKAKKTLNRISNEKRKGTR